VSIIRDILKREEPLVHHGSHYDIPLLGGTGLGKPLMIMVQPIRPAVPIYLAAIGPRNVSLAAEIGDGWLPIFYSPHHADVFETAIAEGKKRRSPDLPPLDMAPTVAVAVGDDLAACWRSLKPNLALYVGGMGAKGRNFYYDLACRYGYEKEAAVIQDNFLSGKRKAAIAAVPDTLVDDVSLCGPPSRIAERLEPWKQAGVTHLIVTLREVEALRAMAELVL
jgi:F420-dependent oxidoreductase-like protein